MSVAGLLAGSATAARGGVVYVTDYVNGTVSTVPSGGGTPTVFATGLDHPEEIVVGPTGTVYVDNQSTGVINAVSASGTVAPFVTVDTGGRTLGGLTADAAGNLYVSIQGGGVVDKITPSGTISTYATVVGSPQELAFDAAGDLFVANAFGSVDKVAPGGGTATMFAPLPIAVGVAVDAAGDVYASGDGLSSIQRYAPTGTESGRVRDGAGQYPVVRQPPATCSSASGGSDVYAIPPGGGTAATYATGFSGAVYLATAVPEPTTAAVAAIAATAGLLGRRRRRVQ